MWAQAAQTGDWDWLLAKPLSHEVFVAVRMLSGYLSYDRIAARLAQAHQGGLIAAIASAARER